MSWQQSPHIRTFKLFALVVAICLASFYFISSVLIPVVISLTFYALIQPAVFYLVRHNINHSLSVLIVLVLMTITSVLMIAFALPALLEQVGLLQDKLPQIVGKLEQLLTFYGEKLSTRIGADIGVRCFTCNRRVLLPRSRFEKQVKTLERQERAASDG